MKNIFEKIIKSGRLAPLLSGLLMVAAFPPLPLGFLAWFALLPLLAIFHFDKYYHGFEKGFIYGFVLNLGALYWLAVNQGTYWYYSTLSMISSVLFVAVFYGLGGSVISFIGKRNPKLAIFAFPTVFTALEWWRSIGVMGFTWNNLCYTQSSYESLIQLVAFTGPFGLSLWIYVINTLIFASILNWKNPLLKFRAITAIIFVFPFVLGFLILQSANVQSQDKKAKTLKVTVVQPNVDPNEKWDIDNYRTNMDNLFELSRKEIVENESELLVWPETAVPTYIRLNRRNSRREITNFLHDHSVYLITGVPDYDYNNKEYQFYNSVFFMNPDSNDYQRYSKMHLVPFGEYIPFSDQFDDLKKLNLGQGNFIAGKEITVFNLPKNDYSIAMTTAICFESAFPDLVRQGVKKGSQLLAIVTNDAWFGNTSAPYLHGEIAKFRAVENHVPVVRAANTGISMIIDKYGRTIKKSGFNQTDALSAEINVEKEKTFYSQTGNWIGAMCVIVMSFLIFISIFRRSNEQS